MQVPETGPVQLPPRKKARKGKMEAILEDALAWAAECNLKGPFEAGEVQKEEFPQHGYGYMVVVQEKEGKRRMATARFGSSGKRSMWQMDGAKV